MTFFRKKKAISTPKISNDLSFLSHRLFLSVFACLSCLIYCYITYKTTISEKNSFVTPFVFSSYFHTHPLTLYFSKYWWDGCMGRPPLQSLGAVPRPPKSLPCPNPQF